MGESVPESSSWEEQRDGSAFLYDFDLPKIWQKTYNSEGTIASNKKIKKHYHSEIQLKNPHLDLVFVFWDAMALPEEKGWKN